MAKMTLDKTLIRELAQLLTEADLSEIEVTEGTASIRVARQVTVAAVAAPVAQVASPPVAATASAQAEPPPAAIGEPVTSPMVGTAYLAPEPGAPPFVRVGDRVSKGQTVLIVEAMKTMNPIPAPSNGTVSRIAVENGQPVEYGETLIVLE